MASLYNKLVEYIKHVFHEELYTGKVDKLEINFVSHERDTLVKQGKFFDNIG